MRNAFISTLRDIARVDPSVFLLCGDLGYSVLEPFAEEFHDRFLNVGVAEQNMIGIAAGLAKEGYKAFTYSIGNFATMRCLEQIRYDVCYHRANVTVVSVGGGFAYGPLGASHHATEDIGILRTIPNMVIAVPGDPLEARAVTNTIWRNGGPAYIRLNKGGDRPIGQEEPYLKLGLLRQIREGRDEAVIASGAILDYCARTLSERNSPSALYSLPFVAPLDVESILRSLQGFDRIITIEEHQLNCGIGSAIAELLADGYTAGLLDRMPKLKRIAIPNRFTEVAGSQNYLRRLNGLELP